MEFEPPHADGGALQSGHTEQSKGEQRVHTFSVDIAKVEAQRKLVLSIVRLKIKSGRPENLSVTSNGQIVAFAIMVRQIVIHF